MDVAVRKTNLTDLQKGVCTDGWIPSPIATPKGSLAGVVIFLLLCICVITVLGTLLVVIVVLKNRSLRKKITNYFIVSLAFSDLFVGLLVMPPAAVQDFSGTWPFGHYCLFWVSLDVMMSTASIWNLCMVAIERYIAVTRPFSYRSIMTPRVAFTMIGITWGLSSIVSFLPILGEWFQVDDEPSAWITSIDVDSARCKPSFHPTYAVVSSCISFYVPAILMIVIYSQVFVIARRHSKQIINQQSYFTIDGKRRNVKKGKTIKTMALLMGIFILCWFPFFIVNSFYTWDPELLLCRRGFLDGFLFLVWMGWINSSMNVFIYSLNPQFRRAYRKILRLPCVTDERQTEVYSCTLTSSPHYNQNMRKSDRSMSDLVATKTRHEI